jgi:predicted alpha/beta superfamily hydrolase
MGIHKMNGLQFSTLLYLILTVGLFTTCYSSAQQPGVSFGRIERFENFKSTYVQSRNIDVWLPDSYTSEKRYSVLYMNDGQNLFDSTITFNKQEWCVDETIGKLIAANTISDCIVVGIWNNGDLRRSEYFPQKAFDLLSEAVKDTLINGELKGEVRGDHYLQFITRELKPFIDKQFSTKRGRANTFIGGSSRGGLISIYAMCEYPDVFGGAACISTHWPGKLGVGIPEIPMAFEAYLSKNLPNPNTHKIYFDYGTETLDSNYKSYQLEIDKIMKTRGYTAKNWVTLEFKGAAHTENDWAKRFYKPILFLLGN